MMMEELRDEQGGVERRAWIMVVKDSRSFASLVSPQIPIMVESSEVHAISRFSESGMTVCLSVSVYSRCRSASVPLCHTRVRAATGTPSQGQSNGHTVSASTWKIYS